MEDLSQRLARGPLLVQQAMQFLTRTADAQRGPPLDRRVTEQMLVGVSTRKYARSLEMVPEELEAFRTSKSAVSRRSVKQTAAQVHEFLARRLDALKLCVLMLDDARLRARGTGTLRARGCTIDVQGQRDLSCTCLRKESRGLRFDINSHKSTCLP